MARLMSSSQPTLAFICGSLRTGSINGQLEAALMRRAEQHGAKAEKVDLGEYEMPLYHGDLELPETTKALVKRLATFDGIVVVSPEYNGGLTPLLKNVIDWTSTFDLSHIRGPVWGIACCTPGPMSGIMGMRQTHYILCRLGAEVMPTQVGVGLAATAFDADGQLIAQPSSDLADTLLSGMLDRIARKNG